MQPCPDACVQVIGRVGFGKSFGSLESLDHPAEGDAFKVVATGATHSSLGALATLCGIEHSFQETCIHPVHACSQAEAT